MTLEADLQRFYPTKETQYLTHSFHPYPHRFVPQIANALIREYTQKNATVLDPFCGSGTVLAEAALLGRKAVGIDLSPLACLISRVKTTPIDTGELKATTRGLFEEAHSKLRRKETLFDFTDITSPEIPEFPQREHWFQKHVLKELSALKELINKIHDTRTREFFLVAFSAILKDVSNASSLYRLTPGDKPRKHPLLYVPYKFREKASAMIHSIESYTELASPSYSTEVHEKDARLCFDIPKADFVLTHPPSFNLDFARSFKLYYWWLYSRKDIIKYINGLDRRLVGTKKVNSGVLRLDIDFADRTISTIRERRRAPARALSKYFYDIRRVLANIHAVLEDNGRCCIQASDFTLYGTRVGVTDTFIELAKRAGFALERRIQRTVPRKALIFAAEDGVEEFLVFSK